MRRGNPYPLLVGMWTVQPLWKLCWQLYTFIRKQTPSSPAPHLFWWVNAIGAQTQIRKHGMYSAVWLPWVGEMPPYCCFPTTMAVCCVFRRSAVVFESIFIPPPRPNFWDKMFLCSPHWPWMYCRTHGNPTASAFWVLRLEASATIPTTHRDQQM